MSPGSPEPAPSVPEPPEAPATVTLHPLDDGEALPALQRATLDATQFAAYRAQIAAAAEGVEVFVRAASARDSDAAGGAAERALALLHDGLVHAVQLRYFFDGVAWIDSLRRVPGGVAIVRMAAPLAR